MIGPCSASRCLLLCMCLSLNVYYTIFIFICVKDSCYGGQDSYEGFAEAKVHRYLRM